MLAAWRRNAPPAEPTLSGEETGWAARAQKVTITRDEWGIPHIEAPTDADAVFGMMYAQAEDDFPRIERNFLFPGAPRGSLRP